MIPIGLGSDHGGFELKEYIAKQLPEINFSDYGTFSNDSVHYPHFADKICNAIINKEIDFGILICGTGIGISMRANRHFGIRAALVYDEYSAKMAKAHNNANILCLGGRTTPPQESVTLIQTWLNTDFEGGRHIERINLIDSPVNP